LCTTGSRNWSTSCIHLVCSRRSHLIARFIDRSIWKLEAVNHQKANRSCDMRTAVWDLLKQRNHAVLVAIIRPHFDFNHVVLGRRSRVLQLAQLSYGYGYCQLPCMILAVQTFKSGAIRVLCACDCPCNIQHPRCRCDTQRHMTYPPLNSDKLQLLFYHSPDVQADACLSHQTGKTPGFRLIVNDLHLRSIEENSRNVLQGNSGSEASRHDPKLNGKVFEQECLELYDGFTEFQRERAESDP